MSVACVEDEKSEEEENVATFSPAPVLAEPARVPAARAPSLIEAISAELGRSHDVCLQMVRSGRLSIGPFGVARLTRPEMLVDTGGAPTAAAQVGSALPGSVVALLSNPATVAAASSGLMGGGESRFHQQRPSDPLWLPNLLAAGVLGATRTDAQPSGRALPLQVTSMLTVVQDACAAISARMDIVLTAWAGLAGVAEVVGSYEVVRQHILNIKHVLSPVESLTEEDKTSLTGMTTTNDLAKAWLYFRGFIDARNSILDNLLSAAVSSNVTALQAVRPHLLELLLLGLVVDVIAQFVLGHPAKGSESVSLNGTKLANEILRFAASPSGPNTPLDVQLRYAWVLAALADAHWITHAALLAWKQPSVKLPALLFNATMEARVPPWMELPGENFGPAIALVQTCLRTMSPEQQRAARSATSLVAKAWTKLAAAAVTPEEAVTLVEVLREALRRDPGCVDAYFALATAHFVRADTYEIAAAKEDQLWVRKGTDADNAEAAAQQSLSAAAGVRADFDAKKALFIAAATQATTKLELAAADPNDQQAATDSQAARAASDAAAAVLATAKDASEAADQAAALLADTATTMRQQAQRPPVPPGALMRALHCLRIYTAMTSFTLDADALKLRADILAKIGREHARCKTADFPAVGPDLPFAKRDGVLAQLVATIAHTYSVVDPDMDKVQMRMSETGYSSQGSWADAL